MLSFKDQENIDIFSQIKQNIENTKRQNEEIEENLFDQQGMNRSDVLEEVVEDPFSDDESPPQLLNSPPPLSPRNQAFDMTTITV